MMSRKFTIALLAAVSLALSCQAAPAITVTAKLDSATLLMGHVTGLQISIVEPRGERGRLLLPPDTLATNVEIVGLTDADTTDLGSGMQEIKRTLLLQSFDSGAYVLPPILYVDQRGDTSASAKNFLKVEPVNVDSLTTIHDYADVQQGEHHFWDFLPDWLSDWGLWLILGLLLAVAALIVYFRYIRKGKLPLMPRKPELPPYEVAIRDLRELRERHLCEKGMEKEYYTQLTDILRTYIDNRFNINAMEMTSTQILQALEHNEDTRLPRKYMTQLLEVADFVKFAAQRPLPDDNVKAFNSALQFVEDTKPQPLAAEDAKPNDKNNTL